MSGRPYKPGPSKIHGLGVIATRLIHVGERVRIDLGWAYRGFNHSCEPTLSGLVFTSKGLASHRVALCDIKPGSELTVSYSFWREPTGKVRTSRLEFICNCPKCRKENVDAET